MLMAAVAVAASVLPSASAAATIAVASTSALEAAVANSQPGDVIALAAGTYAPEGTLEAHGDLTLRGPHTGTGARIIGSNIAPGGQADLVVVDAGATATLSNLTLSQTGPDGAAVSAFGTVAIDHSTVAGNTGPGVLAQGGAHLAIVNSTVTDNVDAGVIAQGGANVTLTNVTVAANQRGIHNEIGSDVRLRNSILANPAGDCLNPVQGSIASVERAGSGCSANIQADAVVDRPAQNGGPTVTRALLAGSPAIDAGDPASCPAEDQRYSTRIGPCDIGAFEQGGTPGTAPSRRVSSLPACARAIHAPARFMRIDAVARGWIGRTRARGARFALSIRNGKAVTRGTYTDRLAGVAVRLAVMSVAKRAGRRHILVRGLSVGVKGGRMRCFTIELRDGHSDRFAIRLSSGYARKGPLKGGTVRIATPQEPVSVPRT
jgi:hypothetical protein